MKTGTEDTSQGGSGQPRQSVGAMRPARLLDVLFLLGLLLAVFALLLFGWSLKFAAVLATGSAACSFVTLAIGYRSGFYAYGWPFRRVVYERAVRPVAFWLAITFETLFVLWIAVFACGLWQAALA